jgi:hypothetical protein
MPLVGVSAEAAALALMVEFVRGPVVADVSLVEEVGELVEERPVGLPQVEVACDGAAPAPVAAPTPAPTTTAVTVVATAARRATGASRPSRLRGGARGIQNSGGIASNRTVQSVTAEPLVLEFGVLEGPL